MFFLFVLCLQILIIIPIILYESSCIYDINYYFFLYDIIKTYMLPCILSQQNAKVCQ